MDIRERLGTLCNVNLKSIRRVASNGRIISRILSDRSGSAMIIALMLSLIVIMLMGVGGKMIATSHQESKVQQRVLSEADNVARAGLVDAMAWFKRQATQPVRSGLNMSLAAYPDAAFYPRYSTDASKRDTIDESLGLVKEYELSSDGKKWARYEVLRQTENPSTGTYNDRAVHDITSQRIDGKQDGEGYVWYIESAGYVYQRNDANVAYNVSPNKIIAKVRASTEIRRLTLSLPANAAFMTKTITGTSTAKTVAVFKNGRIVGGANIGVAAVSGTPYIASNAKVTGTPASSTGLNDPTVYNVFGVPQADLKLISDYVVSDTAQLPATMPDMSLIFVDGNAVFSSTRPLNGSGVLFVNGNLTIDANANVMYSGLIYSTKKVTILEPALISGAVVGYTGLTLSRTAATDVAEIDFDNTIINSIKQQICQYRENKSTLHVFIGVPALER